MQNADLERLYLLLGDPTVMTHYPRPKTLDECQAWIDRNRRGYARDGFGLWILETHDGEFVGDCGLTWQPIGGESLEVGYHVLPKHQGRGYATEAALASVAYAKRRGIAFVIAIIAPGNIASIRVAEKAALRRWSSAEYAGREQLIYRVDL